MSELFDPIDHRPLSGQRWSEARARDGVAEISADAVSSFSGPERLWPNAPEDLEDRAGGVQRRIAEVLSELAIEQDGLAQWPSR